MMLAFCFVPSLILALPNVFVQITGNLQSAEVTGLPASVNVDRLVISITTHERETANAN